MHLIMQMHVAILDMIIFIVLVDQLLNMLLFLDPSNARNKRTLSHTEIQSNPIQCNTTLLLVSTSRKTSKSKMKCCL